ncbi:ATP-grasp domain-containing protein [Romeria aff. gracilis LEGE 07310]|uniref:ATP-grasp domain-containing protein n=1 Tax=Vasconcelosia minhoensis LEGE 07310 TaxID=915328 RepID=A0A8J7AW86_9CYAN|nr:ATP-grasp domain-containing protein [Romeria gracilis]MBE9076932.1 ATP-grasp domain-containing protein [Romeria aff. gracilis LEGE 07310]
MAQPTLFNHDVMNCTHPSVLGNHLYGSRALGLTEPADRIQLHPDLEPEWAAIAAHYQRVGLSHSQHPIWDTSFERLADYADWPLSVFFFGDGVNPGSQTEKRLRSRDPNWLKTVEYVNSKNNFIALAEQLGVSVPQTDCFDSASAVDHLDQMVYPCYVKPAVSVDGVGIRRCQDATQLASALNQLEQEGPVQIQQEVPATAFLNLQYEVVQSEAKPLAATEQVLDGFAHCGNRYPTAHQPWEVVQPLADWMVAQGMRDIFAFDVAVGKDEANPQYWAIECNPRYNGASYPTGIAAKLGIAAWTSDTLESPVKSLEQLDLSGLEYDAQRGTGIVLVSWGVVLVGKINVLIAGTLEEQQAIKAELRQRLQG